MIVRLDLKGNAPIFSDIHDTRILARRHDNAFAGRWQPLEMHARRFIRAMLRPHYAEDAEFSQIRVAAQNLDDSIKFTGREIVLFEYLGRDSGHQFNISGQSEFKSVSLSVSFIKSRQTNKPKLFRKPI